MYLLSYENSVEFEARLLETALTGVARSDIDGAEHRALEKRFKAIDPGYSSNSKLSTITRETLKVLNGQRPKGPSYLNLYFKELSESDRRDVARAMVHANREFGVIDELAVQLFEHHFVRFTGEANPRFALAEQRRESFTLDVLKDKHLKPFMDPEDDSSRLLKFRLLSAKAPVELQLDIGVVGRATWNLRGLSTLKKSHQKLIQDLQAATDDLQDRLRWRDEYLLSEPKPGIENSQLAEIHRVLEIFFHSSSIDLDALLPGIVFKDEPIDLGSRSRAYIGRCEDCDQIVALELFKNMDSAENWTTGHLYHNTIAESHLTHVFSLVHWACSGTHYISSKTGDRTRIRR